jgi:tRNA 2-selenouridine synthase
MKPRTTVEMSQVHTFDEIIDVRTPAEFALDHIPGSINRPVLSDDERVVVGTIHHQESPFAAKKVGAALIAKRIAAHIEEDFYTRPKNWRPLIYCWRGGKRSNALGYILREIGWHAHVLDGGYKSYRNHVLARLGELPTEFTYRVVTGPTGSGKSRILETLHELGEQVLDLEQLANHKGSVLGNMPDSNQPGQKYFESYVLDQLEKFDKARVVFIEAESKKIGKIQVPDTLLDKFRQSECVRIEASTDARVEFLIRDYDYLINNPNQLIEKLSFLKELHGHEVLDRWTHWINNHAWQDLIRDLLVRHYDRLYERSQGKNFSQYMDSPKIEVDDLSPASIHLIAAEIQKRFS